MIWSCKSYCSHFRICIANVRLGICKASACVSPLSDLGMVFVCFLTCIISGKDLCAPQSKIGKILDAHGAQTVQLVVSFSLRSHEIGRVFVVVYCLLGDSGNAVSIYQFQTISFNPPASTYQFKLNSFKISVPSFQFQPCSAQTHPTWFHVGPKRGRVGEGGTWGVRKKI